MSLDKHKALTAVRARAYGDLFGCTPSAVFPPHDLFKKPDERFLIDIDPRGSPPQRHKRESQGGGGGIGVNPCLTHSPSSLQ